MNRFSRLPFLLLRLFLIGAVIGIDMHLTYFFLLKYSCLTLKLLFRLSQSGQLSAKYLLLSKLLQDMN